MGVYNTFAYGLSSGVTYGRSSALQFSVEPFVALATGTNSAEVTWATPGGDYLGLRLLRNQQGYSEHYEDGIVLVNDTGTSSTTYVNDINGASPLISGKQAYYSIWLQMPDYTWRLVGATSCLLPREHGEYAPDGTLLRSSADKFASLIPRTFLSTGKTFLDEIDHTSDLYHFLSSMALIVDEQYTLLENLTSEPYGASSSIPLALAEVKQLGLTELPQEALLTAKRLVRQAVTNYSKKGTKEAVQSFVSALTGYGVDLSVSPNLMLSMQDSTFYKGAGNWVLEPGVASVATFEAVEGDVSLNRSSWVIDTSWIGELVLTSGTAELKLGMDAPITKGIPVDAGTIYQFIGQAKSSLSDGWFNVSVTWYDKEGKEIATDVVGAVPSGTDFSLWNKFVSRMEAPVATYDTEGVLLTEPAMFAGICITVSDVQTLNLDMLSFGAMLEDSTSGLVDYYEARAVEAYLYPSKVNYIYNPSFKQVDGSGNPIGWDGVTSADLVSGIIPGVNNGGVVFEGLGVGSTVEHQLISGEYYVLSAYVKATDTDSVDVVLSFNWDDGVADPGLVESEPITISDTWQRVSLRFYLPETIDAAAIVLAGSAAFQLATVGAGTTPINIGAFQLERATVATDYFDGDMSLIFALYSGDDPTTPTTTEDISYLYYNFGTRVNLLEATLATQVPLNRAYTVTYGDTRTTLVPWSPGGAEPGPGDYYYTKKLALVALSGVTS